MTEGIYTPYAVSVAAEIIGSSGAQMPSRVTNIGFGGCRLIASGRLAIGADVTVKIYTPIDYFESPALVVHSTATELAVMFQNVGPADFTVLRRWIGAIGSATAKAPSESQEIPNKSV